jgi:catechol 2,3-dioxygenase-like lactoylglutathione lyase family enzyme
MPAEPGVVRSISELALWVTDLDAAVTFYTTQLGFTLTDGGLDAGHNAFLKSGDFLLALFQRDSPNTQLANEYLKRTGGPQGDVYHVAFRIDPARLDSLAMEIRDGRHAVKGPVEFGSGRRSYFLEDLDQHYIELTDR